MQINKGKNSGWVVTSLFALLICFSVYSCKHKQAANGSYELNTADLDTASLSQYRNFLKGLDSLHLTSTTVAAKKYVDLFKDAEQGTRDSAFSVFKDFYNKLDQTLDNNKDATISYDSLITDSNGKLQKLSPQLAAYAQNLKYNGFKIYISEGVPYIGQDLDFEAKWFYQYLSQPLKAFLIQLNKEDKEGFSEDVGLVINPEQLANRVVWWENFAKKYSQTIVGQPALENWKSYLGTAMVGMDNSRIMEFDHPQTLSPYYQSVYNLIITNYPRTESAKLVNPYYKALMVKDTAKARRIVEGYKTQKLIY